MWLLYEQLFNHDKVGERDYQANVSSQDKPSVVTSFTTIAAPKRYILYAYDSITIASIINRYHVSQP